MSPPAKAKNGAEKFSYADYLTWPDEERWEIIAGVAFDMTPAPLFAFPDLELQLWEVFGKELPALEEAAG